MMALHQRPQDIFFSSLTQNSVKTQQFVTKLKYFSPFLFYTSVAIGPFYKHKIDVVRLISKEHVSTGVWPSM